jgi:pyruvate,water dikinase
MISWDPGSGKSASGKSKSLSLSPIVEELIAAPRRSAVPGPRFLVWLQAARAGDEARVGIRTVQLGEMHETLAHRGLLIPRGFATSRDAIELFLDSRVPSTRWREWRGALSWCDPFVLQSGSLRAAIRRLLREPDASPGLAARIELIRSLVRATPVPAGVEDAIQMGYRRLRELYGHHLEVVVRCSRAGEDGTAPFFGDAGDHVLGLQNFNDVITAWRDSCATAFNEIAVRTAVRDGTSLPGEGFGVLVMSMVRSDTAVSGFVTTRDPRTSRDHTLHISASRGMGTALPPGGSSVDDVVLAKDALRGSSPRMDFQTAARGQVLAVDELMRLAAMALAVEEHYGCPVQMEWAQDGNTGEFMILQVNPLGTRPPPKPRTFSRVSSLERW